MTALAKMAQTRSHAREISSVILRTLGEIIKPGNSLDTVFRYNKNGCQKSDLAFVPAKINESDTKLGCARISNG